MFSIIYLPFALGLKIIKYVLNNIYLCTVIITKITAKSQFEKLTFSQTTFSEISRLYRTSPYVTCFNRLLGHCNATPRHATPLTGSSLRYHYDASHVAIQ